MDQSAYLENPNLIVNQSREFLDNGHSLDVVTQANLTQVSWSASSQRDLNLLVAPGMEFRIHPRELRGRNPDRNQIFHHPLRKWDTGMVHKCDRLNSK